MESTDPENADCKHICNWDENIYENYGFCEDGYDFYEEEIDEDWGIGYAACATICVPEGSGWEEGYDWSMIEDMTGAELSQDDIDQLNELVDVVSDITQLATRVTLSTIAAASALMMSQ